MASWIARLALLVGSLLILFVVLEVAVRATDLFAESRAVLAQPADAAEPAGDGAPVMLPHPFLGYSGNPAHEQGLIDRLYLSRIFPGEPSAYYLRNRRINAHGFPSEYEDYLSLGAGFQVGIFGGSVAEQLATVGGEALVRRLAERFPERRGRIRVLNFAIGGYKQPQQLINLMLARLQGIRLDVVVNLDGFNEVALSGVDAESAAWDPVFPSRAHYLPIVGADRPEQTSEALIEGLAQVIRERRAADAWRSRCPQNGICAASELARALVGRLVLRHSARAARLEQALQQQAPDPARARRWHSCLDAADREARCWQAIVRVWQQSSLQMAAISEQMGAQYLHVLQPNQYVEGSKPLSPQERRIAWLPDDARSRNAHAGYPKLRRRISRMAEQGVAVRDLSTIFSKVEGDIYVDVCCHFNLRGTRLLAEAIADEIR